MKINFTLRQTSSSTTNGDSDTTIHLSLNLILDGMTYETAKLFFHAKASPNREGIPTLSNVYVDGGLDLDEKLYDYFIGPWRLNGASLDNTVGLIAQNADRFNRLTKAVNRKADDANLYHRHGYDDLAVWLDALHRLKAVQVKSEYDQTPVHTRATVK